jgi:hypothetical protein
MLECLATLIYAAPRVDVQELTVVSNVSRFLLSSLCISLSYPIVCQIREMLVSKFGKDTCKKLIEEHVNPKVQFKLSIETPDQVTVYDYLSEIARSADLALNMEPPVRMTTGPPSVAVGHFATICLSGFVCALILYVLSRALDCNRSFLSHPQAP